MQGKEVKVILFDMDGVIIDSSDAWFMAFNDVLVHFGLQKISKKKFSNYFGYPVEKDQKIFFRDKSIKEIIEAYDFYFNKWKGQVLIFKDSIAVLKKLSNKKIKIGLITNASRVIVESNLKRFSLKRFFDVTVSLNDVKKGKPAPDMVLKACKALKVNPREAILVGDTINDMIAGRKAGCITVGYRIEGNFQINNLMDILKYV